MLSFVEAVPEPRRPTTVAANSVGGGHALDCPHNGIHAGDFIKARFGPGANAPKNSVFRSQRAGVPERFQKHSVFWHAPDWWQKLPETFCFVACMRRVPHPQSMLYRFLATPKSCAIRAALQAVAPKKTIPKKPDCRSQCDAFVQSA